MAGNKSLSVEVYGLCHFDNMYSTKVTSNILPPELQAFLQLIICSLVSLCGEEGMNQGSSLQLRLMSKQKSCGKWVRMG